MNYKFFKYAFLVALSVLLLVSCKSDGDDITESVKEEFSKKSELTDLVRRISLHDGSKDNFADKTNCFSINLPCTVELNEVRLDIRHVQDYKNVIRLLKVSDTDDDYIDYIAPVVVKTTDHTEIELRSQVEYNEYQKKCEGKLDEDDDIECLDFMFPIEFGIYNQITDKSKELIVNSDKELYAAMNSFADEDVIVLDYPVNVILPNNKFKVYELSSDKELYDFILENKDNCQENDHFDYDKENADLFSSCFNGLGIVMHKDDVEVCFPKRDIQLYLNSGWSIGHLSAKNIIDKPESCYTDATNKTIFVCKDRATLKIPLNEVEKYLNEGAVLGVCD